MPPMERKVRACARSMFLRNFSSGLIFTETLEYGLPADELELSRIDMCHAKYYALLDKNRFFAPIGKEPHKILDLGCGTGKGPIDDFTALNAHQGNRDMVQRNRRGIPFSGCEFGDPDMRVFMLKRPL